MAKNSPPSRQPSRVTITGDVAATNATASAFLGPRRHPWMNASNVATNPQIQHHLNPSNLKPARLHVRVDGDPGDSTSHATQVISPPQSAALAKAPYSGSPTGENVPPASNTTQTNTRTGPVATNLAIPIHDPQQSLPSPALSAEAPSEKSFEKNMNGSTGHLPHTAANCPITQRAPDGARPVDPRQCFETLATPAPFQQLSTAQTVVPAARGVAQQAQSPAHAYDGSHQSIPHHQPQHPSRTPLPSGRGSIGDAGGSRGANGQPDARQAPARVQMTQGDGRQVPQNHAMTSFTSPQGPLLGESTRVSGTQVLEATPRTSENGNMDVLSRDLMLCLDSIRDAYVNNGNGPRRELTPSEQNRIKILRGAIAEHDLHYMIAHQFAHTTYEKNLPPAFRAIPDIRATWRELFNVFNLGMNRISGDFAAQIAKFPPRGFFPTSVILNFRDMVTDFPSKWASLQLEFRARGYPALLDEIALTLRVKSMLLSVDLFIASMQVCWGSDEIQRIQTPASQFHGDCWKVVTRFTGGKASIVELNAARQQNFQGMQHYGALYRACKDPSMHRPSNSSPNASTTAVPHTPHQQPTTGHPQRHSQPGGPYAGQTGGTIQRPPTLPSGGAQQNHHRADPRANLARAPPPAQGWPQRKHSRSWCLEPYRFQ